MMSRQLLRFTAAGKEETPRSSLRKRADPSEEGVKEGAEDTHMTGTHVSGSDDDDDIDHFQKSGSVVEIRRTGKGKEVVRRTRTPSPSREENYFRMMMEEILEGI